MRTLLEQFLASARRYPLVAVTLSVFVLLSVANYVLWQRQELITEQHDGVRREGEAMLFALSGQSRIAGELAAVQGALKMIDRNLIVEADLAENLGYFYQMEAQCRVRLNQLNQLSSQPSLEGNPYKSIPFSLRVTGSYPQVMTFLRQLETGPRLARIRTYSFSRADAKNNTLALDLIVEMLGSS